VKNALLVVLIGCLLVTACEKNSTSNRDVNHANNFILSARPHHSPMAGVTFTVEVTFKNMSDTAYTLHHSASGLSYVSVLDHEGKIVQPPMFRDESSSTEIKPKKPYVEKWVLKIEKPGKYQIVAHSRFSVGDENKDLNGGEPHVHNIISEPIEVEVR
jgi:hypothetical protein